MGDLRVKTFEGVPSQRCYSKNMSYDLKIGQMIFCHGGLATGEGSISGAHCDGGGKVIPLGMHGLFPVVPVGDVLCSRLGALLSLLQCLRNDIGLGALIETMSTKP